jgi:hypothetical protein
MAVMLTVCHFQWRRALRRYSSAGSWFLKEFRQGTIDELRRTEAGLVDYLPPVTVLTVEQRLGGVD